MKYEIRENPTYNSHEVYFDGKPSEETRTALKALKMRWNGKKMCWYGFAREYELVAAIQDAEQKNGGEGATVITDGYLGGGAVYGAKSNHCLYDADLAAAIRADIKAAGIKGVTVSYKSYSGGQSITATITIERGDLTETPKADPTRHYICELERSLYKWNSQYIDGDCITLKEFAAMSEAEKEAAALKYQKSIRERFAKPQSLNQYYTSAEDNPELTPAFLAKVNKVLDIIRAYHYDGSNSMVDYFDTNFYYYLKIKPGKSFKA